VECANSVISGLNVTIQACNAENQFKLEFAIGNELYDDCWRPQCVYFSMELAFRWKTAKECYLGTSFGDNQCWVKAYNSFYTEGNQLRDALDIICHDTAAPTLMPTEWPTKAPTYYPTSLPTQWCNYANYTKALGDEFITCGSESIPLLTIEACNPEDQIWLEFAIANKLYEICWRPQCVYYSMRLAFRWRSRGGCYDALANTGDQAQCWESKYNSYYTSGKLELALDDICEDTVPPTLKPSPFPTLYC